MDEEVVARRANYRWGPIFVIVLGLAAVILGILLNFRYDWTIMLFFLGIGLLIIDAGLAGVIGYIKKPKIFITYKDGKLHFSDGTECYPHEIEHVLVKITSTNGIQSTTGGLVITVHGRKIAYRGVKKIKTVESRLGELFEMSRKAYIQRLIELEKEAENNKEADKSGESPASDSEVQS